MKILVVGSKRHLDPADTGTRDAIAAACRQMGKALAAGGHSLYVGSDDPEDVDPDFVAGANEVAGSHKVVVCRPERDATTPYAAAGSNLTNIDLSYRSWKGEWTVAQIHALSVVDLLLVVGGRNTALATGYSAAALSKPVLALPRFEGAARDVWNEVRGYYSQAGLTTDDQETLKGPWQPRNAEVVAKAAESLVKNNPLRPARHSPAIGVLMVVLLLIAAWVAVLQVPDALGFIPSFFVMLVIAALLGTTLRTTLGSITTGFSALDLRLLIGEATSGILIGFGFALLYLVGGLAYDSPVSVKKPEDFERVGITMSILGFAGGFLLYQAANLLREQLFRSLRARD